MLISLFLSRHRSRKQQGQMPQLGPDEFVVLSPEVSGRKYFPICFACCAVAEKLTQSHDYVDHFLFFSGRNVGARRIGGSDGARGEGGRRGEPLPSAPLSWACLMP